MHNQFIDNFSKQAINYSKYRPLYPQALFDFIFSQCTDYQTVWDCATGNGQAVVPLAQKFEHVFASDASEAQIAKTKPLKNVDFFVGNAYNSGLKDESVDLITVATAVHWFDIELFYKEAQRILKPGGIIAFWTYSWHEVTEQTTDFESFRNKFVHETLDGFWAPELRNAWEGYRNMDFPFHEITWPNIEMTKEWTLEELVGYMLSWSSSQKYVDSHQKNPLKSFENELLALWGDPMSKKTIKWDLMGRIGRKG